MKNKPQVVKGSDPDEWLDRQLQREINGPRENEVVTGTST